MTVGIPGSGIGGLFYLAGALWLPVRGLFRRLRGEPVAWPQAFGQAALAVGILAGLWLTGALLGLLVGPSLEPAAAGGTGIGAALARHANALRLASLLAGFGTLGAVLAAVQIARLVVRRPVPAARGARR
ncbi:MAG: hypothetical protein A2W00_13920 [Candidatus Eisenbacteria bacterium RBG_16_71_46]|nr:MAG: hypothetical protein A2W00_13920 [Candidatus Eisenbacteria bacterium RBG_16_71_46]